MLADDFNVATPWGNQQVTGDAIGKVDRSFADRIFAQQFIATWIVLENFRLGAQIALRPQRRLVAVKAHHQIDVVAAGVKEGAIIVDDHTLERAQLATVN